VQSDLRLRDGLATTGKGRDTFRVRGAKVTRAALIDMLTRRLALDAEVHHAKARYHAAVAAQRQLARETHGLVAGLVALLRVELPAHELRRFGIAPNKKRRKPTPDEMLAIVLKRRETRARNAKRGHDR
jgi:hypothetical protein